MRIEQNGANPDGTRLGDPPDDPRSLADQPMR
jgi:hypothetical protein